MCVVPSLVPRTGLNIDRRGLKSGVEVKGKRYVRLLCNAEQDQNRTLWEKGKTISLQNRSVKPFEDASVAAR